MASINNRRSVRSYLPKKVTKSDIELLLKAAMQAPSAKNQQAWFFIVVTKRTTLKALAQTSPYAKMLNEAPLALVLLTDLTKLISPKMYPQDMAAATQNILLTATSLGLGSCWLGVYGHLDRMVATKKVLQTADHLEPFSIVALGYPTNANALYYINRYDEKKVLWEEENYA